MWASVGTWSGSVSVEADELIYGALWTPSMLMIYEYISVYDVDTFSGASTAMPAVVV